MKRQRQFIILIKQEKSEELNFSRQVFRTFNLYRWIFNWLRLNLLKKVIYWGILQLEVAVTRGSISLIYESST